MPHELTQDHKARYIALLRKTGDKSVSARAIGFGPVTIKRHRDEDPAFDAECEEATEEAADALEAEARRRALDGLEREKWIGPAEGGRFVTELHYSDTLLIRLLEANKADKFANRSKTEVTNPDGSLVLNEVDLAAKITSLLAIAEARKKEQDNG